jgi:arsenite methyltransferase
VRSLTTGFGKRKIYPASAAGHLVNPLRSLVQPANRIAKRAGLRPDDYVLELGCGPGWFSKPLSSAIPKGRLVLCDVQSKMLELAQSRIGDARNTVSVCADGSELPFSSREFDKVIVASVLGEVPDRKSCFREVRRVVKDSGAILVVETRRDSDFVSLSKVSDLADQADLEVMRTWGWRWEFTALITPRRGPHLRPPQ